MTKESILRKNSQHLRTEFSSLLIRKTHFSKRVSCKLFIIKNLVTKKLLTIHQKKKKKNNINTFSNFPTNLKITKEITRLQQILIHLLLISREIEMKPIFQYLFTDT